MTSTFSTNLNLNYMATGDQSNAWGSVLNSQVLANIDQALGGPYAANVAGSSDVTLSQTNALNLVHNLTGVLTGNINYIFPVSAGRIVIINNGTTGAFTVTVKASGGTGVVIPQGTRQFVLLDSSNSTAYLTTNYTATVKRQTFTGNGTYTPSAGMLYCDIEIWGAGGGGGGAKAAAAAGSGGGAGGYAKKAVSASTVGASQTVTIGAAGTAGANTGGNGGVGGTTSVGSIVSATGGAAGTGATNTANYLGATGGAGSSGDINATGAPGLSPSNTANTSGAGGSTSLGGGGVSKTGGSAGAAGAANSGSGGSGAVDNANTGFAGGAGAAGYAVVTEYCNQ